MTVTTKEQIAWLPAMSTKVYVTVVDPWKKASPDWWELVIVNTPVLSAMVGSTQVMVTDEAPVLRVSVLSAGQSLMTGATLSTVKETNFKP